MRQIQNVYSHQYIFFVPSINTPANNEQINNIKKCIKYVSLIFSIYMCVMCFSSLFNKEGENSILKVICLIDQSMTTRSQERHWLLLFFLLKKTRYTHLVIVYSLQGSRNAIHKEKYINTPSSIRRCSIELWRCVSLLDVSQDYASRAPMTSFFKWSWPCNLFLRNVQAHQLINLLEKTTPFSKILQPFKFSIFI